MSERAETVQEQIVTTLWSPGFAYVLQLLSTKYDALVHDATHNPNATEKHHYATVTQLALLRGIVVDIFKMASEEVPVSVSSKMNIKE